MSEESDSELSNFENKIILKKEEIESNPSLKIKKVTFPSFNDEECISKKFILSEN
mgnify:FL=1